MSAPYTIIRAAFVSHLQSLDTYPQIAWENMPFTPLAGVPYLKPYLLPGEPVQAELGVNGQNRHPGVYQISIFAPAGTGLNELNTLRDSLLEHFKRGTVLIRDDVTITIIKAFTGPTMQETDWQQVPLSIQFSADAAN